MSEYSSDHRPKKPFTTASNFGQPLGQTPFAPELSYSNASGWTYQKLVECIFDFEKTLDDDHEIGARLTAFGSNITFYLQHVGYHNPDIITFSGKEASGDKLQLVQHVSQLSVLFIEMEKLGEEAERIGFKLKREAKAER